MNFDFINKCYEVEEQIYDPEILRELLSKKIESLRMRFHHHEFRKEMRGDFDFVVWATYGLGPSRGLFKSVKYQVAEKILIELPKHLQGIALVVVDGPFTAFDPYGSSERSMWGSAKHSNHWTSTNPNEPVPREVLGAAQRAGFRAHLVDAPRSHAAGRDAGGAGVGRGEVSWLALHHSRGREQSCARSPHPLRAGDRARRAAHLLRKSGERSEGGAAGRRTSSTGLSCAPVQPEERPTGLTGNGKSGTQGPLLQLQSCRRTRRRSLSTLRCSARHQADREPGAADRIAQRSA